jgi:hypothetical protein
MTSHKPHCDTHTLIVRLAALCFGSVATWSLGQLRIPPTQLLILDAGHARRSEGTDRPTTASALYMVRLPSPAGIHKVAIRRNSVRKHSRVCCLFSQPFLKSAERPPVSSIIFCVGSNGPVSFIRHHIHSGSRVHPLFFAGIKASFTFICFWKYEFMADLSPSLRAPMIICLGDESIFSSQILILLQDCTVP